MPAAIAADLAHALAESELAKLLHRAQRRLDIDHGTTGTLPHRQWLWHAFTASSSHPVTAPYLAQSAGDRQWWRCEPIHVEIGRDQLRIGRRRDAQLSGEECAALAADAAEVLRGHGTLHARHDRPWLLELATPWTLNTVDLEAAHGQSLATVMPTGPDAPQWNRLLNEIQVRWHQHAVNRAREALGLPMVNGLWLHGGGIQTPLPRRPFAAITSADSVLRGWGLASGLDASALTTEAQVCAASGDAVSLWTDLLEPATFQSWSEWIERFGELDRRLLALRERAFGAGYDSVELLLCGRAAIRTMTVGRHDGLRFWRRKTDGALANLLAEQVS